MKITAIQAQVKIPGRYSVFVDGTYSFSLSDVALLESGIIKDQEVSGTELKALRRLSEDDKLYGLALRYATMRPRSIWEMTEYLKRKKATQDASDKIIAKLQDLRLLNDQLFAASWVQSRRLLKYMSKRRLTQELQQKHVSADVIQRVIERDDEQTNELDVLRDVVARKSSRYPDRQKFMQYLARQGFAYDDIKTVLSEDTD